MTLESSNNPHKIIKQPKYSTKKTNKQTCLEYFSNIHTKFSNKFPIFLEA